MATGSGLQIDVVEVETGSAWRLGTLGKLDNPVVVYCVRTVEIIVLRRKGQQCFLLLNKKGNGFEKEVSIRPQMYRVIQAAYGVRQKDPWGLKLMEYCYPREIAQNERTISTRINELKKLCKEYGIKQILTKDHEERWGLNRVLGCCK